MSKTKLFLEKKEFIEECINKQLPILWIIKELGCRRATFKKYYPNYKGNEHLTGHESFRGRRKRKEKFLIPGKCLACDKEHDGSIGNGKYCSRVCSLKRSEKSLLKRAESISKTLQSREKHCWNHGVDSREDRTCPICKKVHKQYKSSNQQFCSKDCMKLDTKFLYRKRPSGGGYRENSGRGKRGRYKGLIFQSTWELAYIVYCLDKNIYIQRNMQKFDYIFQGKMKKYIPDFIINGKFIEIKGYFTSEVEAKFHNFPYELEIIGPKEIIPYIEYAKEKGGNNFYDTLKDI